MITPFYGEFLQSPIALELDLNWCTHACAYCFANLNKPDRTANLTGITNLLRDFRSRETLEAQFLQQGYPILFSNKVDPFAASNHKQALVILRLLRDLGIPVALQTKGARNKDALATFDESLELIAIPSAWYISISTLDEEIAKRLEPGAPTIAARFAMIERLVKLGHKVTVGLNPIVPEWCPDVPAMLQRIADSGALGVWIESLHLSSGQTRNLSARDAQNLTQPLIKRASARLGTALDLNYCVQALDLARASTLHPYCANWPHPTRYFDHMAECYPRLMPTGSGFLNWCHENKRPGDPITFAEFWRYCEPMLPVVTPKARLKEYIGATAARTVKKTHIIPQATTWPQLLAIYWQEDLLRPCPARNWAFIPKTDRSDPWRILRDAAGLPIYQRTGMGIPWREEGKPPTREPLFFDTPAVS
jgi:DNA repair photolyase